MKNSRVTTLAALCGLSLLPVTARVTTPAHAANPESQSWQANLLSRVASPGKNTCVSPYSLSACLALLKPGAAGQTLAQLDIISGSIKSLAKDASDTALPIEVANRVYFDTAFSPRPDYLAALPENSVDRLPFASDSESSRKAINSWVEDKTHDRIQDLLPKGSINAHTRLVAVNAIYMNAKWQFPFSKDATRDSRFTLADGKNLQVPTMQMKDENGSNFAYPEIKWAHSAIAMPYQTVAGKQGAWMVCLLPPKGQDTATFLNQITPARLAELKKDLAAKPVGQPRLPGIDCLVSLPKFKFDTDAPLTNILQDMGIRAPFSEQADFSRLSAEPVCISTVVQKTFIAVDEEKTEAAAATAAAVARAMSMPMQREQRQFFFDRPFVFIVLDTTDAPAWFLGCVENPKP